MAPRNQQRQQPRIPDQVLNIVQYLLTADQNKTPIKRAGKCLLIDFPKVQVFN